MKAIGCATSIAVFAFLVAAGFYVAATLHFTIIGLSLLGLAIAVGPWTFLIMMGLIQESFWMTFSRFSISIFGLVVMMLAPWWNVQQLSLVEFLLVVAAAILAVLWLSLLAIVYVKKS